MISSNSLKRDDENDIRKLANSLKRDDVENDIHKLAKSGKNKELRLFITKYPNDINKRNYLNITPLHEACYYGHLKVADTLIKSGADINAEDNFNKTPLHYACRYGHLSIVQLLYVQHGADVDAKDRDNKTPLDIACQHGQKVVVSFLSDSNTIDIARKHKHERERKAKEDELFLKKKAFEEEEEEEERNRIEAITIDNNKHTNDTIIESIKPRKRWGFKSIVRYLMGYGVEKETRQLEDKERGTIEAEKQKIKEKKIEEERKKEEKRQAEQEVRLKEEALLAEDESKLKDAQIKALAEEEVQLKEDEDEEESRKIEVEEDELLPAIIISGEAVNLQSMSIDDLLIDDKLTPQEGVIRYISSEPMLRQFNFHMQLCFQESFLAAARQLQQPLTLDTLRNITEALPIGGIVLIGAASIGNNNNANIEFRNLAALSSSNAIDIANLSSAIARQFTIFFHEEIKGCIYVNRLQIFSQMKLIFAKAVDDIVDTKLTKSFTCENSLDWLAADMTRILISYILRCNAVEMSKLVADLHKDRSCFISKLIDIVVQHSYPTLKSMPASSSSQSNLAINEVRYMIDDGTKYSDSEEVRKLKEANNKHEKEIIRLRKITESTKNIVDAFIDTTGIGNSGQVQAAFRTADGNVHVTVDNPIADQKISTIAQMTEYHEACLDDHSLQLASLKDEIARLRKKSNNDHECIIS